MLALERDLAVSLSGIDDAERAIRAVVDALAPAHRACGVAAMAIFPEGRRVEARGPFADAAIEALDSPLGAQKSGGPAAVVPFGDERGAWGGIALVSRPPETADPDKADPVVICSLERIGILLSTTLRRIETAKRLDRALRDQDLLMREMRHRVRNSLQLVVNFAPLMLGEAVRNTKDAQGDFQNRIAALISIHDMLSWTEAKDLVSARTYFRLLVDALRRVTANGCGTLILDYDSDEDPALPVDQAASIGLIVHELVVNSTKHTRRKNVRMDLYVCVKGSKLLFRYSDVTESNAVRNATLVAEAEPSYGENESAARRFPAKGKEGLGLELVEALLARARGKRSDDGSSPHRFEAKFSLD